MSDGPKTIADKVDIAKILSLPMALILGLEIVRRLWSKRGFLENI